MRVRVVRVNLVLLIPYHLQIYFVCWMYVRGPYEKRFFSKRLLRGGVYIVAGWIPLVNYCYYRNFTFFRGTFTRVVVSLATVRSLRRSTSACPPPDRLSVVCPSNRRVVTPFQPYPPRPLMRCHQPGGGSSAGASRGPFSLFRKRGAGGRVRSSSGSGSGSSSSSSSSSQSVRPFAVVFAVVVVRRRRPSATARDTCANSPVTVSSRRGLSDRIMSLF